MARRLTSLAMTAVLSLQLTAGCGGGATPPAGPASSPASAANDTASSTPDQLLSLMAYSVLDTASGVFEGDWSEPVNDQITCMAAVRVVLRDSVITEITITDSSWLHPVAAERIPQRIIAGQRLPVEAVSGASVSSWTVMGAVAVALGIDLRSLEDQQ